MTRTGAMLGTVEYMSPEQAQGKELTASSDVFTFGLILYQLVAGVTPFYSESVIASLLMRAQQRAIPLSDIDKQIPGILSNIVAKCLETDQRAATRTPTKCSRIFARGRARAEAPKSLLPRLAGGSAASGSCPGRGWQSQWF